MNNKKEVLAALEEFAQSPSDKIPDVLEKYLREIAKTGETMFEWEKLKPLFLRRLDLAMKEFHDRMPTDHIAPCPNVENINFADMRTRLLATAEAFPGAPFTIQRLCELITDPQNHYKQTDKFLRGIEKNVLVVSTVDPFGNKIVKESFSVEKMVNGMETNGMDGSEIRTPEKIISPFLPPPPANSPITTSWFSGATSSGSPCSMLPAWPPREAGDATTTAPTEPTQSEKMPWQGSLDDYVSDGPPPQKKCRLSTPDDDVSVEGQGPSQSGDFSATPCSSSSDVTTPLADGSSVVTSSAMEVTTGAADSPIVASTATGSHFISPLEKVLSETSSTGQSDNQMPDTSNASVSGTQALDGDNTTEAKHDIAGSEMVSQGSDDSGVVEASRPSQSEEMETEKPTPSDQTQNSEDVQSSGPSATAEDIQSCGPSTSAESNSTEPTSSAVINNAEPKSVEPSSVESSDSVTGPQPTSTETQPITSNQEPSEATGRPESSDDRREQVSESGIDNSQEDSRGFQVSTNDPAVSDDPCDTQEDITDRRDSEGFEVSPEPEGFNLCDSGSGEALPVPQTEVSSSSEQTKVSAPLPTEVSGSSSQLPSEVSGSSMQLEVSGSSSQLTTEVSDSSSQLPTEVSDSSSQLPTEAERVSGSEPADGVDSSDETPVAETLSQDKSQTQGDVPESSTSVQDIPTSSAQITENPPQNSDNISTVTSESEGGVVVSQSGSSSTEVAVVGDSCVESSEAAESRETDVSSETTNLENSTTPETQPEAHTADSVEQEATQSSDDKPETKHSDVVDNETETESADDPQKPQESNPEPAEAQPMDTD